MMIDKNGQRWCPTCGEKMEPHEAPHETVKRVVRPGHRFGNDRAGAVVEVEPRHLVGDPLAIPALQATMSMEEHEALTRPAPPKEGPKPRLLGLVEQNLEAVRAQVRQSIEHGKAQLERAAEKATAAAATVMAK